MKKRIAMTLVFSAFVLANIPAQAGDAKPSKEAAPEVVSPRDAASGVKSPRDAASGLKSPQAAGSGQATGIISPRDAQSGLPAGKSAASGKAEAGKQLQQGIQHENQKIDAGGASSPAPHK